MHEALHIAVVHVVLKGCIDLRGQAQSLRELIVIMLITLVQSVNGAKERSMIKG